MSTISSGENDQQQQPRNAFPSKLHKLISLAEKEGKTDIVSWTSDGKAFKVRF
jgi:hypothetical protein